MNQIIYVDREAFNLGDIAGLTADQLRLLAKVPDTHDLWRVADWGYREWLKGPMVNDEKVTGHVFLGPATSTPARFFTAPRIIGASSGDTTP